MKNYSKNKQKEQHSKRKEHYKGMFSDPTFKECFAKLFKTEFDKQYSKRFFNSKYDQPESRCWEDQCGD